MSPAKISTHTVYCLGPLLCPLSVQCSLSCRQFIFSVMICLISSVQNSPYLQSVVRKSQCAQSQREKGRDLTQSCDKNPHTHKTIKKSNIKTPKALITQPLRTDLGQSIRVTAANQLVWLNRFTSAQPSH